MNNTNPIRSLFVTAAFAVASLATGLSTAAAPMAKTSALGFHRMMVGDFEVTVLSDGTVALPMGKLLTNVSAAEVKKSFDRNFIKDPVETSVNVFVVNTGSKLVMIDAGAGKLFGPTLGNVVASLKAAGYQPEQVDEIYITHMHGDHVGGLVFDGMPAYPNAIVRADKRQFDTDSKAAMAQRQKAFADAAEKGYWIGASHLPFPGVGHLRREGSGYAYVPANYSVVR